MKQKIMMDKASPYQGALDFSYLLDAPAGKYGHVQIKYPCKKCVVKMLVPVYDEFRKRYQKQVEDFTDILEIDYSPDTIQEQEQLI